MPKLTKSHDLRLPEWGPYTKRYTGISHIPDPASGLRFDLGIVPGHYRRQVLVPNAKWESQHHAWEASPGLEYYTYRYELEWKDQVYCDVSFSTLSPQARLVRCEFVNQTGAEQNLVLHWMAAMNFPPVRPYSDEPIQKVTVRLPEGGLWIDALDYETLEFARPRPTDQLVYDAMLRGEIRQHGFVNGSGIGQGFGRDEGDTVLYRLRLERAWQDATLALRYRTEGQAASLRVTMPVEQVIDLPASGAEGAFGLAHVGLGSLAAGEHLLQLISAGGPGLELDGFALVEGAGAAQVRFLPHLWNPVPELLPGPTASSLILKYADVDIYYGLAWNYTDWVIREILNDELDGFFRHMVHEHVRRILSGPGEGHFTNVFLRPIPLGPHSSRVIHGLVCSGNRAEVEKALAGFSPETRQLEGVYQAARARTMRPQCKPSGEAYHFSQERMAATTLLNVVYPVYTRRSFIRHYTPGKWWDCLYTWDSGFIGLGLLEIDPERAIDCLNAYVTDPGDPQAAFVHHGSMVPVQMYLFHELWQRTQSADLLAYFYPRLRQYYLFLAGRLGSSTTRVLKSNLLKTWDYFYNSGGWDDYPPQVYVHQQGLENRVSPAVTTAHAIRSARILQMAAQQMDITDDNALYEEDIAAFSEALQRHAWDEQAGYFSYVVHDETGRPREILRHESGANFDMGMDGASPLYAGICTAGQEAALIERLFSPERMWTPIGLSTVDQSAPYYRKDGYWNGAVWMPHQWFFWKALLDLGHGEQANQIARTALDLWQAEVANSYYCFEHFIVQSGRGAGWHQFSGLSTPVMAWFNAYHRPGRLTVGLDGWIERQEFSYYNQALEADLRIAGKTTGNLAALVSLQSGPAYQARWNGAAVRWTEIYPGTLQVEIPRQARKGKLVVETLPRI